MNEQQLTPPVSQRPLPAKPAMPSASEGYLEQIATLQKLALQELREQRQLQERIFSKLRDLWLLAILPLVLFGLWLLWFFFANIR